MPRSIVRVVPVSIAVLGTVLWIACGGSPPRPTPVEEAPPPPPPPSPVHLNGANDVHGVIGPAGGSISLASGLRIEIPEGALREDVTFDAAVGRDASVWSREEGEVAGGQLYELRPVVVAEPGHTFRISATARAAPRDFVPTRVVLGMEEERPRRAFTDVIQTLWQSHPARHEGQRYVADVAYLGGHRLQFGLIHD